MTNGGNRGQVLSVKNTPESAYRLRARTKMALLLREKSSGPYTEYRVCLAGYGTPTILKKKTP